MEYLQWRGQALPLRARVPRVPNLQECKRGDYPKHADCTDYRETHATPSTAAGFAGFAAVWHCYLYHLVPRPPIVVAPVIMSVQCPLE
jgi:hypothetical protein